MKLSKKIVTSSILSLGLTMGVLAPSTQAFDLATANLTPISNILHATFDITAPTNLVTLSWADGSSGNFTAAANEVVSTSVNVTPNANSANVTVLLKVPRTTNTNIGHVAVIQPLDVAGTPEPMPVEATFHDNPTADQNYVYYVLGEKLYVSNSGSPISHNIPFDITFNTTGGYSLDIIAVEDYKDMTDSVLPTVSILGNALSALTNSDSISVSFSERITYESKALVQKAILDSFGANPSEFKFHWNYNGSTESVTAYNESVNTLTYISGHTIIPKLEDLNGNYSTNVQILQ